MSIYNEKLLGMDVTRHPSEEADMKKEVVHERISVKTRGKIAVKQDSYEKDPVLVPHAETQGSYSVRPEIDVPLPEYNFERSREHE